MQSRHVCLELRRHIDFRHNYRFILSETHCTCMYLPLLPHCCWWNNDADFLRHMISQAFIATQHGAGIVDAAIVDPSCEKHFVHKRSTMRWLGDGIAAPKYIDCP